tara:strand:+ start:102 stop:503 length:402 start_codon:yes stop_codon:yes gene_type:complete
MASVGVSSIKLIDSDGDALDDGAGKLNVNATLAAGSSIDIGDVEILGHGSVAAFAQNVTDSSVVLTSAACKHADIMANVSNTGIVYIGRSGVSATTGIALYPGDVYSVDITNTDILHCMSTVSGDDINVLVYS